MEGAAVNWYGYSVGWSGFGQITLTVGPRILRVVTAVGSAPSPPDIPAVEGAAGVFGFREHSRIVKSIGGSRPNSLGHQEISPVFEHVISPADVVGAGIGANRLCEPGIVGGVVNEGVGVGGVQLKVEVVPS